MEGHVKFIALAEIRPEVSRPLIGFGQQHPPGELLVQSSAQIFENYMSLRQIFAGRAFAFDEIRNGVQSKSVHTHLQPEAHDRPHFFADRRIVIVKVRLVAEKTMPII